MSIKIQLASSGLYASGLLLLNTANPVFAEDDAMLKPDSEQERVSEISPARGINHPTNLKNNVL